MIGDWRLATVLTRATQGRRTNIVCHYVAGWESNGCWSAATVLALALFTASPAATHLFGLSPTTYGLALAASSAADDAARSDGAASDPEDPQAKSSMLSSPGGKEKGGKKKGKKTEDQTPGSSRNALGALWGKRPALAIAGVGAPFQMMREEGTRWSCGDCRNEDDLTTGLGPLHAGGRGCSSPVSQPA